MANRLSDVAGFKVDNAAGSLTDISSYVNSVATSGGNALVEDTGLGMTRRKETQDLKPVMAISISGYVNTTTEAIVLEWLDGFDTAVTVEHKIATGEYITGEANVGAVSVSAPIGLQTFSAEFRSSTTSGFAYTGTAAT